MIDATTAPGYAGEPLVTLDGLGAGATAGLYVLASAPNSEIHGLSVIRFTDGIVLESNDDQSLNHMREEGMAPNEAILASVRIRIRPIFMTTSTTVLGLSPLVFFPGAGSELYRGLGAVVLGGLLVSTIFTLIMVPTLFSLMMQAKATQQPC